MQLLVKVTPQVSELRQASRRMVRELGFLEEPMSAVGLARSESHLLIELELAGQLTAGELTERLRLDKSSTSRVVSALSTRGLVQSTDDAQDRRRRPLVLTAKGKKLLARVHLAANTQVQQALSTLSVEERATVVNGMKLYARALARGRRGAEQSFRKITSADDAAMAQIIRSVMTEHGATGAGFAIHDPEVDHMSRAYRGALASYLVVTEGDRVVGGAGFGPLVGGDGTTCELRKMYFLPSARGTGMGRKLLLAILDRARAAGYSTCYLETMKTMHAAQALYRSVGFLPERGPLGNTGHFGCDAFYTLALIGKRGRRRQ